MGSMANPTKTGQFAAIGNVNASLLELNPATDRVVMEELITTGYFTDNIGIIHSSSMFTGSTTSTNKEYYFDILNGDPTDATSKTQFAVAYGHYAGSGSDCQSGSSENDIKGPSEVIYKSFASMLLPETAITGGFTISASDGRDDGIYVLVAERANMQDGINRKNWTLTLSGSDSVGNASTALSLTDDSATEHGYPTFYGLRYNIVSGSQGRVAVDAATKNYGWFYPNLGLWIFSENQLSSSVPGTTVTAATVAWESGSQIGFATNGSGTINENNALRFANVLNHEGSKFQMRNEEFEQSVSWFCRVPSRFHNFSTNPTFVSGSHNELRHKSMIGNPQVFITTIGLYNGAGEVVAVARLSTPLQKNFGTEATIKVKLTY